ncbi:hypothetical protein RKE29_16170 [Streptomyces sp. B1866]|uniref:hypothetical protein n=1 Tax=Streptomyces sp. B1866 TaxID=3075431 RepID=UPI0028929485|nr:hypothetical protein [Streptomyces sp. B1866]MDT3398160.1 hypothetical protein [Streptomyces sp. B1866]
MTNGQARSGRDGSRGANSALAAALKEAGCSYASLAHRVNELGRRQGLESNYDKASVTRWLHGGQPRGTTPELIAAVLSQRLSRPVAPADLGFVADRQRPVAARALVYSDDVSETLHTLAELGSTDISRRSMLGSVPFVAGALMNPQREWLLWLVENQEAGRLEPVSGAGRVEQVHAAITMFDEMDNRFGGGQVRASIVLYLSTEVIPMLQQRGTGQQERRQLFTAAAKLAATAGWSSYDNAEYGLAQRYMTQALRLCAEGGDRVLGGQILAGLSHLATNLGQPQAGVELARVGIATARHSGSPLGLMRLHAMAARGHAALNDAAGTTAALRAADAELAKSQGADQESPWVRYLDHHYLQAEAALCFRDLGNAAAAERAAGESVRNNADRRRRQAISRSVLATAYLQQDRLDEAMGTAEEALDTLSGVHSERSVQALRDFRRRLVPCRDEPVVRRFEQRSRPVLGMAV